MIKKSPQFYAGKLLGFYEAGDKIMDWINATDSQHLSTLEFRKALYKHIMLLRPELK